MKLGEEHRTVYRFAALAVGVLLAAACSTRRGPNIVTVVGGQLAPARNESLGENSTAGKAGLDTWFYHSIDNGTMRGRFDFFVGGSADGPALDGRAEVEAGVIGRGAVAKNLGPFARIGFSSELSTNPTNLSTLLELPSLKIGLQYRDPRKQSPWHIEISPKASLGMGGWFRAGDESTHMGFAPGVGGHAALLYNVLAVEASLTRYYEDDPVDITRASLCAASGFALCLDYRRIRASFVGVRSSTHLVGVTLGFGLITGVEL